MKINFENFTIGVVGLGYVGLPLSIAFSQKFNTIGYDINRYRIADLNKGIDKNRENFNFINKNIKFSNDTLKLKSCNFYIITVPTPIKKKSIPDLKYLVKATKMVAKNLKQDDIVVFESTVYPGATEEVCLPILEKFSNLKLNENFFIGYSPERINPGDKSHTIYNTVKITSGSNKFASNIINKVYGKVIKKTHIAESIKIAESAKIIENTQRDINIALINEFSILLKKMNISVNDVLHAAGTKWNFLKFKPGLVGGHCIGIDPYYLSYKFKKLNLVSNLILAGRSVNDNNHKIVANDIFSHVKNKIDRNKNLKVLVLGFTFKENCTDIRNSKIFELIKSLQNKSDKFNFETYDPNYKEKLSNFLTKTIQIKDLSKKNARYDLIIIAVPHSKIKKIGIKRIKSLGKKDSIIYDYKLLFGKNKYTVNF
tara:strand:+ start:20 stop:1300 length:1281 start_codon:yes stop_codon:yes gene_type:complete